MFHVLVELVSASAWTYAVVVGFVALDAFFPVVPGETVVITAAVLAGEGALSVALVLAAAFVGAVMGDNVSYLLGRTLGSRAVRKLFRGDKARRRLDWARRQLRERGRTLIVGARFIPGGRTAVTFSAGTLGMAWRRFLPTVALGCALWAVYATALGYLGGVPFSESVWKPLLVALGVAGLVAIAGEAYRRLRMNGGGAVDGRRAGSASAIDRD